MRTPVRVFVVAAAMAAAALLTAPAFGPVAARAAAGPQPPELVVATVHGDTFDLAALRGRVVLVNFWATWCAPCRQEMPALDAFYKSYHARGVELIGVSADKKRDAAEVRKVAAGVGYPVAMASEATKNSFGAPSALPVTYLIDRTGAVRAELRPKSAPLTADDLAAAVSPLLSATP